MNAKGQIVICAGVYESPMLLKRSGFLNSNIGQNYWNCTFINRLFKYGLSILGDELSEKIVHDTSYEDRIIFYVNEEGNKFRVENIY